MVGRFERQRPADRGVELRLNDALVVGKQAEDLAQVHARGVEQLEAVGFRPGQRLFVGIDAALAERLQADASHEALASIAVALDLEILVVDIERTGRVLGQDAVVLPVAQKAGGPRVAVVVVVVGGLFLVEDQPDDVVWAAVVKGLLEVASMTS